MADTAEKNNGGNSPAASGICRRVYEEQAPV
jgi:hypothetical protein